MKKLIIINVIAKVLLIIILALLMQSCSTTYDYEIQYPNGAKQLLKNVEVEYQVGDSVCVDVNDDGIPTLVNKPLMHDTIYAFDYVMDSVQHTALVEHRIVKISKVIP